MECQVNIYTNESVKVEYTIYYTLQIIEQNYKIQRETNKLQSSRIIATNQSHLHAINNV